MQTENPIAVIRRFPSPAFWGALMLSAIVIALPARSEESPLHKESGNTGNSALYEGEAAASDGPIRKKPGVTADVQNHNSSRSNRTQPAALDPDSDDDSLPDGEEVR